MGKDLKMEVKVIAGIMRMKEAAVNDILKSYSIMTDQLLPRVSKGGLKKWSYVLEYVKDKSVHALLSTKEFVDLVVDQKITKGADVRKLSDILGNPAAAKVLKKKGLKEALTVVGKKDPTIDSAAFKRLAEMTAFLKSLKGDDLTRLRTERKPQQLLRQLSKAVKEVAHTTAIEL
jgi:hypothetical protein